MSSQRYFLDRAARTLNAEIVVDTGPPALLGEIVVEGNKDVSTTYIRDRAPWKAGTEPWNESRVQDYVDELRGLGLFSMELVVREGPPRSVSAAARYETDSGIGVEGEWEHRNFFGNGEKLVVSLPITPEKQGLKASFEKPAFLDRDQKLVGEASLLQEITDAYDRRGLRVGADVEMAGVPVGRVASIKLDDDLSRRQARVVLILDKDLQLPADTIASVKTSGLIGDKYVNLTAGGSEDILASGDTLEETESAVDIESLISKYALGGV